MQLNVNLCIPPVFPKKFKICFVDFSGIFLQYWDCQTYTIVNPNKNSPGVFSIPHPLSFLPPIYKFRNSPVKHSSRVAMGRRMVSYQYVTFITVWASVHKRSQTNKQNKCVVVVECCFSIQVDIVAITRFRLKTFLGKRNQSPSLFKA